MRKIGKYFCSRARISIAPERRAINHDVNYESSVERTPRDMFVVTRSRSRYVR
jgi:hypothetical protein